MWRPGRFNFAKYLESKGVSPIRVDDYHSGKRYLLANCLFNESHVNGEACFIELENGSLVYKCLHESCKDNGWREAKKKLGTIGADSYDAEPKAEANGKTAYDLEVVSNSELDSDEEQLKFLVDSVIVGGQSCLMGGAAKSLKTSIATDLAVSVASGGWFLGEFAVDTAKPVLFVSAESGKYTLRDTMRRVCAYHEVPPRDIPLYWSFRRPKLTLEHHLEGLRRAMGRYEPGLLILDPAYLLLLTDGESASNVFRVGEALRGIQEALKDDVTFCLLHHTKKPARGKKERMALADFAFAGFGEWARQWLMLDRSKEYDPGSGHHEFTLECGGSAGHGGIWDLVVDEGRVRDPLRDRHWSLQISPHLVDEISASASEQDISTLADAILIRGCEDTSGLRRYLSWGVTRFSRVLEMIGGVSNEKQEI